MEQKSDGSRSSRNTDTSPSEQGNAAGSNNQEDDKSGYGSEEFDGQSRAGTKELDVTESEVGGG